MEIDKSVRLIALQFSYSINGPVPLLARRLPYESPEDCERRKEKLQQGYCGETVISPTENCSLSKFLAMLDMCDYELVDALYQERVDYKSLGKPIRHGSRRGAPIRTYHMVRYLFVPREFVHTMPEFDHSGNKKELLDLVDRNFWRVRAYDNYFFKDGELVPGLSTISINLEVRVPLFRNDGSQAVVWDRDDKGYKVGSKPHPLRPSYNLTISPGKELELSKDN